MKTKLEIIEEVASSYTSLTRAVDPKQYGTCRYLTEDGKKCAVGRALTDEAQEHLATCHSPNPYADELAFNMLSLDDQHEVVQNGIELFDNSLDPFLKEEYKGHDPKFWANLQNLHDNSHFWDENGLNDAGNKAKQMLINKYYNGMEDFQLFRPMLPVDPNA